MKKRRRLSICQRFYIIQMFELLSLMIFCKSLELCYHGEKITKFINRDTLRKSCVWACWWLRGWSFSPSIGNYIWSITVKKEIWFHTWLTIIWFLLICKSKWCREVVSRKHKTSRSGRKWFICTLIKDAVIVSVLTSLFVFLVMFGIGLVQCHPRSFTLHTN